MLSPRENQEDSLDDVCGPQAPFTGRFVDVYRQCVLNLEEFEAASDAAVHSAARRYLEGLPSRTAVSVLPGEVEPDLDAGDIKDLARPTDDINGIEKTCVQDHIADLNRRFSARAAGLSAPLELPQLCIEDLYARELGLRGANLEAAELPRSTFFEADCTGVQLRGALLIKGILRGCFDLADLRECDLRYALIGFEASAIGADFQDADLTLGALYDLDLSGANLRGAFLDMLEINHETTFFGARGIEEHVLGGMRVSGLRHRRPLEKNGFLPVIEEDSGCLSCAAPDFEIQRAIVVHDAVLDLSRPEVKGQMVLLAPVDCNQSCFYVPYDSVRNQLRL